MKTNSTHTIKKSISAFAFLLLTSWVMAAAPTITVIGASFIRHQVYMPYTDMGATAVDENGMNITAFIQTTVTVNPNIINQYMVQYNVTDVRGNFSSATRVVDVTDMISPNIIGLNYIEVCLNDINFVEPSVVADDNYFPSVQLSRTGSFDITVEGTYMITYTATDDLGNTATFTRTIKVVDCTAQTTGIAGINNLEAKIYPNPATDNLTIDLKYGGNYTATLYSIEGKAIITQKLYTQSSTMPLAHLAKGLYTLLLVPAERGNPIQQKIIITK